MEASEWRDAAKSLGVIVLSIAGVLGGMYALIVANDSVIGPIAEGRSVLVVVVVGAVLTVAAGYLAAKATIEPPRARYAVIAFAVCCGTFTFFA